MQQTYRKCGWCSKNYVYIGSYPLEIRDGNNALIVSLFHQNHSKLGGRVSEWMLLKGQSRLFLQPFMTSRGCSAALQVAIISERGKSGDETSHGEPQGSSSQAAGVLQGEGWGCCRGWRDHQSCWTKRNSVELDMTNPRLAEWPKSDSQIALWPIRQLHRFPASSYWHTTVSDKRGTSAGYQMLWPWV